MSGISCDCSVDVDCGPELHNAEIRTARKEHKCCECYELISPGDKYEYVHGLWECDWRTYKTCFTCMTIRNDYCPWGWIYGDLRSHLWECLELDYVTGDQLNDS